MAQIKTINFTNPSTAIARDLDIGFTISEITSIDISNGGSWQWVFGMASGSSLDVDDGSISNTNGFTPFSQDSTYGATISGFTNAGSGVISVNDTTVFGFTVGDTIRVSDLADDGASALLGLNGDYIIAAVSPTSITVTVSTTARNSYVSGGVVTRVSDADGFSIPTENFAVQGVTLGTTVVGADDANMVVIVKGQNPVV